MNRVQFVALVVATALLVPVGGATAASAPACKPYCDDVTTRVVNRLDGAGHGGWLATVLDQYGYKGRRWAEITRIPKGHGKSWVGVIHVPDGNGKKASRALDGWFFAQKGTRFVLPLVTKTNTQGGTGKKYRTASRWAAVRLGKGWQVRTP